MLVVGPRVMFNLAHDDPPVQGPAKNDMSLDLVMACLARFSPYWDSRSSCSVIVTTCTCQRSASAVNQLWDSEHAMTTVGLLGSNATRVTSAPVAKPGA